MTKPARAVNLRNHGVERANVCAAPSLPPAAFRARLQRTPPAAVPFRAAATALWIIVKYLLVPVMYIPFRLGVPTCWAYRIDAYVRRTLLPVTESPEERLAHHITPRLQPGEFAPRTSVRQRGRVVTLYDVAPGRQLLLILFRGSWCTYSQLHLADAAQHAERLRERGVEILAVSSRRDEQWWKSKGVDIPLAADRDGALFDALGVKAPQSLLQKLWGTLVPYESVFLFDIDRRLIASDVRSVSNTRMRQRFVSTKMWLDLARQEPAR